jgi:hypothetical protein
MNPAQRNNNPINLEFAHQHEATGSDGRFAIFPNAPAGWRAAHAQIILDRGRKLTLREFLMKFAPPDENDTAKYIIFVARNLNTSADVPLSQISAYALAGVMAMQEGYYSQ